MKNLITIIFLLFFGWTLGFSQAYAPFPTDSTVWRERWEAGDGGQTVDMGVLYHYLVGDTIINGKLYSILYGTEVPFLTQYSNGYPIQPRGYIREENKSIYFYPSSGLWDEGLIYDFNLEVGDTMYWDPDVLPIPEPSFGIVVEIDSIQITNGDFRKRYFINGNYGVDIQVIEGIGSVMGLLMSNVGQSGVVDWITDLSCVSTPQNLIYTSIYFGWIDDPTQCLDPTVSTEEVPKNSLKVFPNPTSHIINLSKTIYQARVEIFSATGQKVLSTNNFTGSAIDLKDLPSGLYLLVISGDEEYVGKIIKNR